MRFLLIHTCGTEGSVALAEDAVVASADLAPRTFSESLVPVIEGLLAEAGWRVDELGAVGVVTGPGSFTGVRTGLSVAKGLCEARGIPLIGVSRLALIAGQVGLVHVLLDAGRGEFYYGRYREGVSEFEGLVRREDLEGFLGEPGRIVVCEEKVLEGLTDFGVERMSEPKAGAALALVMGRWGGRDDVLGDANYLRRTDGEIFAKPIVGRVAG